MKTNGWHKLLAISLMLALLAGCGGVQDANQQKGPGSQTEAGQTTEQALPGSTVKMALPATNQSATTDEDRSRGQSPKGSVEPNPDKAQSDQPGTDEAQSGQGGTDPAHSGQAEAAVSVLPPDQPTAPAKSAESALLADGPVAYKTLEKQGYSGITEQMAILIRDQDEWSDYWQRHTSNQSPPPAAPTLDFSQYSVLAVHMGQRNTGGYSVEIKSIQIESNKMRVTIYQSSPPPGGFVTMALTQPYHLVLVPKVSAAVTLEAKWQ